VKSSCPLLPERGIITPDVKLEEETTMHNIAISPELFTLLRQRARQTSTSPDRVVEEALRIYFDREEPA